MRRLLGSADFMDVDARKDIWLLHDSR
jgi:hypothetical protein